MIQRTSQLKRLMFERNLTIEQLSEETGLAMNTIMKVRRAGNVQLNIIERLCEFLQIDGHELISLSYVDGNNGS